ncbi:uncharacterized protein F5147DRAFT_796878 [Suillus discolor]|uniref:Uncharacterized protein n=1 Tax=Suillus discolor TaxID=1912936 RepID=A0A9P7ES78_9AGAM|nr:uncharacterized protein F5147DRAFT_796878 [Suillus discolor]KAG2084651.1 hypothetical protein F5147DRAFT_796878 [Suillus discolor]
MSTTNRVVPSGVLDGETMISGRKADAITPWTSWTLAVRKYDAKVINNMDLCSCSDKAGAYLADTYPILCFVPGYLSQLNAWHKEEHSLYNRQLDAVRRRMHEGTARPSFASFTLEHQKQYQLEDKDLGYIAGAMFVAGSDMIF